MSNMKDFVIENDVLVKYTGSGGDVVIPECVTKIGDKAFYECEAITSVFVPGSVMSIGEEAFLRCRNMAEITFSEGLQSIGKEAFVNCRLDSITLPYSVNTIGAGAFQYSRIRCVTIPASVLSIGENAFDSSGLETLRFAGDLEAWLTMEWENLGLYGLAELYIHGELLKELTIPESITTIRNYAFHGYDGLTKVTIPESVQRIGDSAFSCCKRLSHVELASGVVEIGGWAFNACESLAAIMLPESVMRLGPGAFRYCNSLTSITLPSHLESIGERTFEKCELLADITISESIACIGGNAFEECKALKTVRFCGDLISWLAIDRGMYSWSNNKWQDTPLRYGAALFFRNEEVRDIRLPDNLQAVPERLFEGCESLESIVLPESVTSVGGMAFRGCKNLMEVSLSNVTSFGRQVFQGCEKLTSLEIPFGVTVIVEGMFINCHRLAKVSIPDSVTTIEKNAFRNCYGLVDVTIPESVTRIGDDKDSFSGAFEDCRNLTSIIIPGSVLSIGNSSFSSCGKLKNVTIMEGVTHIGDYAFSYCDSLIDLTIPNSVLSIGEDAFSKCDNLKSVTLPSNITIIKYDSFEECKSLTDIMIPDSVKEIQRDAFEDCDGLRVISMPGAIEEIHKEAFPKEVNYTIVVRGKPGNGLKKFLPTNPELWKAAVFPDLLCSEVPVSARKYMAIRIADKILKEEAIQDKVYNSYLKYILAHKEEWYSVKDEESRIVIELLIRQKQITITEIDGLIERVSKLNDPELLNRLMAYQTGTFQLEDYDRQTEKEFRQMEKNAELRSDPASQKYINAVWTVGRKEPYVKSLKEVGAVVNFPTKIGKTTVTGIADGFEFRVDEQARESIEEIVIPEGYTCIGSNAFYGCINLKKITLPSSVTRIGYDAFEYCSSLETICFGSLDAWLVMDKSGWEDTPLRYGGSLYLDGECLQELVIPDGMTRISPKAFEYYTKLTSVTLPGSVQSIGSKAFSWCRGLTRVNIPESVRYIGAEAFACCEQLINVTLPEGLTEIEKNVFRQCTHLVGVKIPQSVMSIGAAAFYHCERLPEVSIPERLKSIGDSAFEGCKKLRSMELPKSVLTVGSRAFAESGIKALIVRSARLSLKDTRCLTGCRNYLIYAPRGSQASQYIPDRTLPLTSLDELTSANSTSAQKVPGSNLAGLTFVVTGDMASYPDRSELKAFIESAGGRLTGSISGKTNYLIANDPNSGTTKLQKARQLGVNIIDEEAFLKMAGLK